jgi:hypothetical protein
MVGGPFTWPFLPTTDTVSHGHHQVRGTQILDSPITAPADRRGTTETPAGEAVS